MTALKQSVSRQVYRLNSRSRAVKFNHFWRIFQPQAGTLVLNLGASPPHRSRILLGTEDSSLLEQPEQDARWRSLRVIGCNLNQRDVQEYNRLYSVNGFKSVVANGCNLPFPDKSIDIVFSNAVIEHLDRRDQAQMAREIMRVGRSWFVTTPNFWYPIELHNRLPFIHFLPTAMRHAIQDKLRTYPSAEPLNLLAARDLLALFPNSRLLKVRVTFYPETLIAYHHDMPQARPESYDLQATQLTR